LRTILNVQILHFNVQIELTKLLFFPSVTMVILLGFTDGGFTKNYD
jgi:hypothetical protein